MKRNFLTLAILLVLALPAFGQGAPGQSNYPISQQAAAGAPSGTCPGTNVQYLNTSNGNIYTCPTPGGSWVLAAGGSGAGFANLTGGTNNSGQAMLVGNTASTQSSLAPNGTGQLAGNQLWLSAGVLSTTPSFAITGGSINCGHNVTIRIALNTAAGLTLASASLAGSDASFGCSGGTAGVITIPAPTLPTGFVGASFYVYDSSSGSGVGNEVLQASCSNIVTSCVLTSINNTGAAPLTTPTAYLNPANLQATECPPGVIASVFSVDDSGNYHTYEGVDLYSNNSRTAGTPTICHTTAFTDQGVEPVVGNNAFVAVDHTAGVNTNPANQDRALWVNMATPASDTASRYSVTGLQVETDLNGATTFPGGVDNEVTGGSFQVADLHTNSIALPGNYAGVMAGRFSASRTGTGTWSSCKGTLGVCMAGVFAQSIQNNAAAYNGFIAGIMGSVGDASAGTTTSGVSLYGLAPGSTLATGYTAYLENAGPFNPPHSNANLISASDTTGIQGLNFFKGPIVAGIAGNAAIYAIYGIASNGAMAINTLTKLNTNSPVQGAKLATTDLANAVVGICTVYCAGGASTNAIIAIAGVTPCVFDNATTAGDYVGVSTGTAGDCTDLGTSPTVDTIGRAQTTNGSAGTSNVVLSLHQHPVVQGNLYRTATVCSASGTAANPSVVTCGAAAAGLIYCDVAASGTTCTVNTSAVTANSSIHITPNAADGTTLSKTCNPAPTVVPFAILASKSAGVSFTINMPTLTVNGACFEYSIVN